eukprot:TRINITY_DN24398_c0_g1_i4.p1 TRINITY_DN24398_c0_g1~~TRINITY_DN24398_c0_g1_i4.p1  ORF type:complete len:355 (+),score=9.79 TRINITY_DN24398_c0_g1_i4:103-1065(+)
MLLNNPIVQFIAEQNYLGIVLKIGLGALGLSAGGLAFVYAIQRKLIYVPVLPDVPKSYPYYPDQFNLAYEDISLTTDDGLKLHAWMIKGIQSSSTNSNSDGTKRKPVVLFFQENAGNMSWRLPFIRELVGQVGCRVLMLSYRGYGNSEGSPEQKGIQLDSKAAFEHVLTREDVDTSKIVLMGKSLGGAVAIHLAAKYKNKVRALLIENTFTSIANMVPRILPILGFAFGNDKLLNFLVKDKWENWKQIKLLGSALPVLMYASVQDELVPYSHMIQLRESCSSERVKWVQFDHAHHMDAFEIEKVKYWQQFKLFWHEYVEE